MKLIRIGRILALSVILILLIPLFPTPAYAAEYLFVYPFEGEIGTWLDMDGNNFRENDIVFIYLSSQEAEIGDSLNAEVTAYEQVLQVTTDEEGFFDHTYTFTLPDVLNDGEDVEYVHDGDYYFYAVYFRSHRIAAIARFIVLYGEISLDIEEGGVGTEVEITGLGLGPNQAITMQYDGNAIAISGGDSQSDNNGDFTCTLIIPESWTGSHIISALDELGNSPDAEFTVTPLITINPTEQVTGGEVQVSGTGFDKRSYITITLDGEEVVTTPLPLRTDHYGSFEGSFLVPASGAYGTRTVEIRDDSFNKAQAQLVIGGDITLSPTTSIASPGHVGMELKVSGAGFNTDSTITVTYRNNGEDITVATTTARYGAFEAEFIVPPSNAGSHDITASDGTNTAIATFIMEAQAPPIPMPLTPEVASTAETRTYFDWSDVSDDSGISYTLQVATDTDFNAILLNKAGLGISEYTLTEEEELEPATKDTPYYWRVEAVDGALNESEWTYPRLFYIGFSPSSLPIWTWYIIGTVAAAVVGIVGFWMWKNKK
jgi:hypothetical protein